METQFITITECCINYHIDPVFIDELEDSGVIVLTMKEKEKYIHHEQLAELEKYIHLYYDLNINIEGIDAIRHLLQKMILMQQELNLLQQKLQFHQ
ncbi:hypothetical protein PBAL39_18444 [Pedobacter sp. BAL39]|uniref:chaperone modulator CbpM n=1 Tax=Pedobacter sp. BAL39 TaxID=391596 RepID=UPI0001559403|nr:chaperone modulator CbpM [Pedobacter sp. BAL39]EDM36881.1 hypothetical protein PBAL39_18444 [Pedobacter sp. BAL39]